MHAETHLQWYFEACKLVLHWLLHGQALLPSQSESGMTHGVQILHEVLCNWHMHSAYLVNTPDTSVSGCSAFAHARSPSHTDQHQLQHLVLP